MSVPAETDSTSSQLGTFESIDRGCVGLKVHIDELSTIKRRKITK